MELNFDRMPVGRVTMLEAKGNQSRLQTEIQWRKMRRKTIILVLPLAIVTTLGKITIRRRRKRRSTVIRR